MFSNRALSRSPLPHAGPYSLRPDASSGTRPAFSTGLPGASSAVVKTKGQRFVLIHTLAMKALSETEILEKTKIPKGECLAVLQKIGSRSSANDWQLTDLRYKELDPYNFKYPTSAERESAIDNAARAFDRLRVPKDDKLWDKLNPISERGKGKVLSKLNLTGPATSTPIANRLSTKSSSPGTDNITGLLSADESVRPQSSHKIGAAAAERSKRLFSKKPVKPVPPKAAARADNERKASGTVDSENDMAKKGVAVRVTAGQKRKAESAKYKSAERIEDSDIDDDDLNVKEPATKRIKTDTGSAKPVSAVTSVVRKTAQSDNEKTTAAAKATSTEPKSSPSLAATSVKKSSNAMFGSLGAASANAAKIRKVPRVANLNGASSETEKPRPASSTQQQQQKSQLGSVQKKKEAVQDGASKNKGSASLQEKVKGLPPSSSLPPKPPKSVNPGISNARHNTPSQAEKAVTQTNKSKPNAASNSSLANGGKQTPEINNIHKRINSTSTISSTASTAVPAIFTPAAHRNSTSSSQSTSSMVSTRSEVRNQNLKRSAASDDKAPPAKKVHTEKSRASPSNSSPLTAASDLGDTPLQTIEHAPAGHVQTAQSEAISQPTPLNSQRARLSSMRTQYTKLFSSFVDYKVAYLKAVEADEPFCETTYNNLTRCSKKVKAMEKDIKTLMLEVQDWTWWDGVPASFKTPHEGWLREKMRRLHAEYLASYDQYEREHWPEGSRAKVRAINDEIDGLGSILHPSETWEFVDDE